MEIFPMLHLELLAPALSFSTSMQAFTPALHHGSIPSNTLLHPAYKYLSYDTLHMNILTWEPSTVEPRNNEVSWFRKNVRYGRVFVIAKAPL